VESPPEERESDEPPVEIPAGEAPSYETLGPKVWFFGGLMLVIGLVTAVLMFRPQDFPSRSFWYLAFYAIPANTAISVFPHEVALAYYGTFANIWVTAAVALAGTVVAAYMDHTVFTPVLNLKGRQQYKEKKLYRKAARWFMKYPFATIVVAGATPIPFWPFKFLSFSVHYPMWKYVAAVALARYPRYVVLAWAGAVLRPPMWIFVVLFAGILLTYLYNVAPGLWKRIRSRSGGAGSADGTPARDGEDGSPLPAADRDARTETDSTPREDQG
jgi:membrane protein YqaA with SNARE-associated domain